MPSHFKSIIKKAVDISIWIFLALMAAIFYDCSIWAVTVNRHNSLFDEENEGHAYTNWAEEWDVLFMLHRWKDMSIYLLLIISFSWQVILSLLSGVRIAKQLF